VFKKSLQDKLERIFQFKKSTFDIPSDSFEQDTLFIDVEKASTRVLDASVCSRVEGSITVFSQSNRLPFGYFSKAIDKAAAEYKKDLFFFDVDIDVASSPARLQNIHEKKLKFVFLFKEQFNPERGEITSITIQGGS